MDEETFSTPEPQELYQNLPQPWIDYDPTQGYPDLVTGEWHAWTAEELAEIEVLRQEKAERDYIADMVTATPDALTELAGLTADNSVDINDLQDAIIELAALIAEQE